MYFIALSPLHFGCLDINYLRSVCQKQLLQEDHHQNQDVCLVSINLQEKQDLIAGTFKTAGLQHLCFVLAEGFTYWLTFAEHVGAH